MIPLYFVFADSYAIKFVTRPGNTAALRGTDVTLQCSFDEEPTIDWRWYVGDEVILFAKDISGGHPNQDMYSLDAATDYNNYDMTVDTADVVVAATYECEATTSGSTLTAYGDILLLGKFQYSFSTIIDIKNIKRYQTLWTD